MGLSAALPLDRRDTAGAKPHSHRNVPSQRQEFCSIHNARLVVMRSHKPGQMDCERDGERDARPDQRGSDATGDAGSDDTIERDDR